MLQPPSLSGAAYLEIDLLRLADDEPYGQAALTEIRHSLEAGAARSLDVNVLAPFLLIQALLAELEAAKATVINIGSIHARLTKRGFATYATSKAALAGMTRAWPWISDRAFGSTP